MSFVDPDTVDSLKVAELRELCEKYGLPSNGRKAALVKRVQDYVEKEMDIEPSSMSVAQLKDALRQRGLSVRGKKAALVSRLEDALGDGEEEEEEEEEEEDEEMAPPPPKKSKKRKATTSLTSKKSKKKRTPKVDKLAPHGMERVYEEWDCMLNQTNITGGRNNNKYYIVQILKKGNTFYNYTRWGRVGEDGKNACSPVGNDIDRAIKAFKKKFKDKTKNDWDNRHDFVKYTNKYELIDMAGDDEEEAMMDDNVQDALNALDDDEVERKIEPSKLDKKVQDLVKIIFDLDMFKGQMKKFDLDIKKMPLGAISKNQLAKGYAILEAIKDLIEGKSRGGKNKIGEKTAEFYTKIPHSFGRRTGPVLNDLETVQKKMEMLNVLGDIEIAQGLMKKMKKKGKGKTKFTIPNPLDVKYDTMNCELTPLSKKSKEFKIVEKHIENTRDSGWGSRKAELLEVFEVDRDGVDERFDEHADLDNRKLLWHGTNIAVVVAILNTGLRIMPHSGGRVGKGIYFASENSKSAGYVSPSTDGIGVMFLAEVALGKEHHITRDDWTLTKPPAGKDCVVAQGQHEPDSKGDEVIMFDGNRVVVPAGKPKDRAKYQSSSFDQTEYLVYKESQQRLRYLCKCKF